MLLKRVTLQDFGLYQGLQEFDLEPRVKYGRLRPIILFGGKNGAGKSTLLEAILVCLYGRNCLGDRVRQADYHRYLARHVHQPKGLLHAPIRASVSVEFDHVHMGVSHLYEIRRSWEMKNGNPENVEESLRLLKDGNRLEDLAEEYWDDFLRELIPPGLSQLFFFDGEKIQRLAEEVDNQELGRSIKSLLGLDLVERLQTDLQIYLTRQTRKTHDSELTEKVTSLENTATTLTAGKERLSQEQSQLQAQQIDHLHSQIESAKKRLAAEGSAFSANREKLAATRGQLLEEIRQYEERLRDLAAGLLPFSLCPNLCSQLRAKLQASNSAAEVNLIAKSVDNVLEAVLQQFLSGNLPGADNLDKKLRKKVVDALKDGIRTMRGETSKRKKTTKQLGASPVLEGLSKIDQQRLINWIDSALGTTIALTKDLGKKLERATRQLQQTESTLAKAPEDDVLKPIIGELSHLQERKGALDQKMKGLLEESAKLEREVETVNRELAKLSENAIAKGAFDDRIATVVRVQSALQEYLEKLTTLKVGQLRDEVASCFNRICRKGDLLQRIEIDPKTFQATLFDGDNRPLPKERLSAGEKQIFAISMLWALARTSGRPLPVIIDTPLARLDADHRRLLLEQYFPLASHQVLILSTDTEVDEKFFEILSPHISHAFHLKYNMEEKCTKAEEGYFWKEKSDGSAKHPASSILH